MSRDNVADGKRRYAAVGMLIGTAVATSLGMILWLATGQPLYLLIGALGAGVGLGLGAALDASLTADSAGERQAQRSGE